MRNLLLLLALIILPFDGKAQKLEILNLTGRPLERIVLTDPLSDGIKGDSIATLNILKNSLADKKSVVIKVKQDKIYNLHAFSSADVWGGDSYFILAINGKTKKVTFSAADLESSEGIAPMTAPIATVNLINQTNCKIYLASYKLHSVNEFKKVNVIKSWDPLRVTENRTIRFIPDFTVKNDEYIYENLDFYFYGIDKEGKVKEFTVLDFDVVNKEDVTIR